MKADQEEKKIDKVWITKYALTQGVYIAENVTHWRDGSTDMIQASVHSFFHGEGREWHRTEAAALARADQMRKAKVASMKKQIEKLEKKVFVVKP